jgi:hypothetical protein
MDAGTREKSATSTGGVRGCDVHGAARTIEGLTAVVLAPRSHRNRMRR